MMNFLKGTFFFRENYYFTTLAAKEKKPEYSGLSGLNYFYNPATSDTFSAFTNFKAKA
jgi:hypothetical protein